MVNDPMVNEQMVNYQDCDGSGAVKPDSLLQPGQRCPLCQQFNHCGNLNNPHKSNELASSELDCWCLQQTIPLELLDSLAPELRGKACICQSCVNQFNSLASG